MYISYAHINFSSLEQLPLCIVCTSTPIIYTIGILRSHSSDGETNDRDSLSSLLASLEAQETKESSHEDDKGPDNPGDGSKACQKRLSRCFDSIEGAKQKGKDDLGEKIKVFLIMTVLYSNPV